MRGRPKNVANILLQYNYNNIFRQEQLLLQLLGADFDVDVVISIQVTAFLN